MRRRLVRKIVLAIGVLCICCFLVACSKEEGDPKRMKDLDFTVVEEADLPEELHKLIQEKKKDAFKLSFATKNSLYIVRGYGSQKSGGYSIAVQDLYLGEEAIFIQTELIGPSQQDLVSQTITYPYVVVKIEFIDKNVTFK